MQLTGELAELEGSALHQHLKAWRDEIVLTWTASDDDRRDLIAKGEKRILDQLIRSIEEAKDTLRKRRQGAERKRMSHAF